MIYFKCKLCGGNLLVQPGGKTAECESCGTVSTLPNQDEEEFVAAFNRAAKLRFNFEFDRAINAYEKMITAHPDDAELYWNMLLCKYGVEYVYSERTGEYLPTIHRVDYSSVLSGSDYREIRRCADEISLAIYEKQARQLEEIRNEILAKAQKQEKHDIFISYKETDDGERTMDSVRARKLYDKLTEKGFKVFYAPESLTAGKNYEAEIFSAIESSKVMILLASESRYMESVWVRNEWMRFLERIDKGQDKFLIPAYWDLDPNVDFPLEIRNHKLQGINLSVSTGEYTLLEQLDRLLGKKQKEVVKETVVTQMVGGADLNKTQKMRASIALEDRDFTQASEFFNNALNQDPYDAEAYWGLVLCQCNCLNDQELIDNCKPFEKADSYNKAIKYAKDGQREKYMAVTKEKQERIDKFKLEIAKKCSPALKAILDQMHQVVNECKAIANEYTSYRAVAEEKVVASYNAIKQDGEKLLTNNYIAGQYKEYEDIILNISEMPLPDAVRAAKTLPARREEMMQLRAQGREQFYHSDSYLEATQNVKTAESLKGSINQTLGNFKNKEQELVNLHNKYKATEKEALDIIDAVCNGDIRPAINYIGHNLQ